MPFMKVAGKTPNGVDEENLPPTFAGVLSTFKNLLSRANFSKGVPGSVSAINLFPKSDSPSKASSLIKKFIILFVSRVVPDLLIKIKMVLNKSIFSLAKLTSLGFVLSIKSS